MSDKRHESLFSEHPELAELWDYEKNYPLTPKDVPSCSNKKVWWKCKENHSYERTVYNELQRNGVCPVCNGKLYVKGVNDVKTKFPDIAKEWDKEANGDLKPEDFSYISREKAGWICSECRTKWIAPIKSRCVRGNGCPNCAGKKRWENRFSKMDLGITDPNVLLDWDYELNEKGPECYTNQSSQKAHFRCHICGYKYMSKISNKYHGRKCACCQRKVVVPGKNDLATTHPWLAEEWDSEKNGDLTPQMVLYGQNIDVFWRCPMGHSYKASLNHRSSYGRETNCPVCNSGRQTSFAEQAVFFYVKKIFPDAISRYNDIFDNGMELDIYIPSKYVAIEYDGEAWHKKDKRSREKKKYEICRENGIRLIRLIEKPYENEPVPADEGLSILDGPMYEPKHLEKVIYMLLNELDDLHINRFYDINIKRDEKEIRKYMTVVKGSLAELHPDIAAQWDYEENGDLTPDKVKPGSGICVGWICPDCGNKYKTAIGHRTGKKSTGCPRCGRIKNVASSLKPVEMINLETGEVLKTFKSISEASRELHISSGNISMICKGTSRRTKAGGYGWRYKD